MDKSKDTTLHRSLSILDLHKRYRSVSIGFQKGKVRQALAGVSITLGPGLYGLLGPNGAGKSTLIGIITGTLAADSGEVLWCGRPAQGIAFRRILGYMPQQQGLYDSYTGRRFPRLHGSTERDPPQGCACRGGPGGCGGESVR